MEVKGLRGWEGQRVDFGFPIVAIVGENGTGKSTLLQAAAALYRAPAGEKSNFASKFFPDTPWDQVTGVEIRGSVREGANSHIVSVRKPTTRWLGNPDRKVRAVRFLDLRRTQPIYARVGYARLAKSNLEEADVQHFEESQVKRFASVVGKQYSAARQATTTLDENRAVPVVEVDVVSYSGFHQGAGEATLAELVALSVPEYSLVLIDEIETSLHPRAQRRLVRDLATISRTKRVQFLLTTHSPYVLEELPPTARVQVVITQGKKEAVQGVSPEFALTRMDEDLHPEADVYVEDPEARILVEELFARFSLETLGRIQITAFGSAAVGTALGQMNNEGRFGRPTIVILDADQVSAQGCYLLPGDDAPERVVFQALATLEWQGVAQRINRSHGRLIDAVETALTLPDHHDWVLSIADAVTIGRRELWRVMCTTYARNCLSDEDCPQFISDLRLQIEERV